jgi:NitT/TauT family transport system ATP-binding protein
LVDRLHDIITGHELPDVAVEKPPSIPPPSIGFEPLPEASPNEIIGLLEFLDARGGKDDIFRIATETNREFGSMIALVKAAEMLAWVDTPRRDIVLTSDGKRLVDADAPLRKEMWRAKLLDLRLFKEMWALIQKHGKIERSLVMQIIALRLPQENYERTFDTFVSWARFGDLFAYDDHTEELTPQ